MADFEDSPVVVTVDPLNGIGTLLVRRAATGWDVIEAERALTKLGLRILEPEESGDSNDLLPDGSVKVYLALR